MKKQMKRLLAFFLIIFTVLGNARGIIQVEAKGEYNFEIKNKIYYENLYPIMGETSTCLSQMINYYESKATYPSFYASSDAPTIYEFCKIYLEECKAEGVRAEVAFAQAMKETNFLRYGGDVDISQYNFAGLGATGNGNPGNSFPSVRIGVRAQIQHLKAYATTDKLVNEQVDPRYKYVNKGSAPYVQWLGKYENPSGIGWATAVNYGYSIVNDYMSVLLSMSTFSTWYDGVNYADVYDPDYYMLHNPDVANACGANSDTLMCHFLNCGMSEGRVASASFDVIAYKKRYQDLQNAYGSTMSRYYYHYMNYGKDEGRLASAGVVTSYNGVDYSAVYDYDFYLEHNEDVARAYAGSDVATLEHFVKYGMKEGRSAKQTFDVQSYKNANQDLRIAYGNDLKEYYLHYIHYGQAEGRTTVGVAEVKDPITCYDGIDYSAVYNYNYYISVNNDVKEAYPNDDIKVLEHFVKYGMKEGRRASESFDVSAYMGKYEDLRNSFGSDLERYYYHYMQYGQTEGRSC